MATLEKIRKQSGLLVTVIGFALLAFIVGDMVNGSQSFIRQSHDKVVEINGKKVTTEEFQKAISELTEVYKMQTGQSNLSAEYMQQINNQAYESFVRQTLMSEEASKIGMRVSSDELQDLVSGDNISPMVQQMPFFINPETGAFDKALLMNFLQVVLMDGPVSPEMQQARTFWLFWEKNIKTQRLEEKFNNLLASAMTPNSLDVKSQFDGGRTSVDFAYVMQSLNTVPDSLVKVTDSEVEAQYRKVRDARFKQGQTRAVKYFYTDIVASEQDYADAEASVEEVRDEFGTVEDIASFVNLNSDVPYVDAFVAVTKYTPEEQQFIKIASDNQVFGPYLEDEAYRMYRVVGKTTSPDSIEVRHIMLPIQDEAVAAALADSLVGVLNKGGNFEALAAEFSVDTRSAQNGGSLGWFTEIDATRGIGPEFRDAAFNAKKNSTFKVRSKYGMHVAQVVDVTKPVEKAKVAQYAINVTPSSRTTHDLYSKISAFIATNNNLKAIEENASENGFNVLTNSRMQTTDYTLGAIKDARSAVQWAFHNEIGKVSDVKEIDNKFVVVVVTGETPEGYTPLAQVKDGLRFELVREKKAAMIAKDLESKSLTTLDSYAKVMDSRIDTAKYVSFNTPRITGIGSEPILNGSAPYVSENTLTGPLAGNNAVYVFSVFDKEVNDVPFDKEAELQLMVSNWNYRTMYQSMAVLQSEADIKDYRINFY